MATFGIRYPKITELDGRAGQAAPLVGHAAACEAEAAPHFAHGASRIGQGLGLIALIALSFAGNLVATAFRLPLPGPVLAGVALVVWLARRPGDAAAFAYGDRLIAAMPLLFVPLVVGALASLRLLGPALTPFVVTMLASTLAALAATILAARATAWLCSRSR